MDAVWDPVLHVPRAHRGGGLQPQVRRMGPRVRRENILAVWLDICHRERIFSFSGVLLVTERRFSLSGMPLVTERDYSRCLAHYWSQRENILVVWLAIGHRERIFSLSCLLLVTERDFTFTAPLSHFTSFGVKSIVVRDSY